MTFEHAYRQRLQADLERWQEWGVITPAIAEAIRGRMQPEREGVTIANVVAIVGGLLIAAAFLAFIAANLGAQEMIGMCASGAKYGIMTAHFYWLGAVPAMVFVGVFMMPFYYGSKARSVSAASPTRLTSMG